MPQYIYYRPIVEREILENISERSQVFSVYLERNSEKSVPQYIYYNPIVFQYIYYRRSWTFQNWDFSEFLLCCNMSATASRSSVGDLGPTQEKTLFSGTFQNLCHAAT